MNNLEDKINTKDIIMERACLIFYWMANRLMRHRRCLMHVGERKRDEALIITRAIACEERQSLFDDTFGLRQTTAFHPRFGGFHFVVGLAFCAGVKFAALITHLLLIDEVTATPSHYRRYFSYRQELYCRQLHSFGA